MVLNNMIRKLKPIAQSFNLTLYYYLIRTLYLNEEILVRIQVRLLKE